MKIAVLPKTPWGRWSVGLVVALIILFAVVPDPPSPELTLLGRVLAIIFAGMAGAALVTGLVSVAKRSERSVLVFLATAIGLFALVVAVAQAFDKTIGW